MTTIVMIINYYTCLIITELNSPKIFMWTSTRLERIGSSAVIFCRSNGHPKPTIKWLGPDDKPLIKSNKYQIMSNGDLYIKNIRWNDMGPYTCIAENRFGQDKTVAFLYPTKVSVFLAAIIVQD